VDGLTRWATRHGGDASQVPAIRSVLDKYPPGSGPAIPGRASRSTARPLRAVFRSAAGGAFRRGSAGASAGGTLRVLRLPGDDPLPPLGAQCWRRNGAQGGRPR
jgi:hypothetical protein